MRRDKVILLLKNILKVIKVKNKKAMLAITLAFGLAIGLATVAPDDFFGKDIDLLPTTPDSVVEVIKEEAGNKLSDIISDALKGLF